MENWNGKEGKSNCELLLIVVKRSGDSQNRHAVSKRVHAQAVISLLTANHAVTFDISGGLARKQEVITETRSKEQGGKYR